MRTWLVKSAVAAAVLAAVSSALAQAPSATTSAAARSTPGEAVAFYALAALAAGCALGCVVAGNIVRMAVCLLGTLGAVALLYFLMAANFLGAIQLIVYAGGTLVVIVFGVMLTSRAYGARLRPRPREMVGAAAACAALLAGLVALLLRAEWAPPAAALPGQDVAGIGAALLSRYLVPFELVSVLLLAVMIGAAYLSQPPGRRGE